LDRDEPQAGEDALAPTHPPLGRGQILAQIAVLVLQETPKVLVGQQPKQTTTAREAGGKLEIREVCAPVTPAQPVLLLGQVIVTNAGPMQLTQCRFGGGEIRTVPVGLCDLQRHAVDPAAYEGLPSGE